MAKKPRDRKNVTPKPVAKKLIKSKKPAVDLINEIKAATRKLAEKRATENAEPEYAFITTTKVEKNDDVFDEFTRENNFLQQASQAATDVIPKIRELGIPTDIPNTYKGEMMKDERQMGRIRENLKSKKESIEKSKKMKKLRELKKIGKKIQEEVLRKRSKEKKEFLEKVKTKPVSELFE